PTETPVPPTATPTKAPPQPTPTPEPTAPPSDVELTLDRKTAAPNIEVKASACIPPIAPSSVFDGYVLVRDPAGKIYSVRPDGGAVPGYVPYVAGVRGLPNVWCGTLFTHTICPGTAEGIWTVGAVLVPAGSPVDLSKAIGCDLKGLEITG
ncbi:MAG TPA: hypothetical protein PLI86_08110, partial [bacterium]|nr:hypothetical protein [bacterium]